VKLPVLELPEWAICSEIGSAATSAKIASGAKPAFAEVSLSPGPAAGSVQSLPAPATKRPLVLRDGRIMWRFRASEIPPSAASDAASALLDRVRRVGVVVVADGLELPCGIPGKDGRVRLTGAPPGMGGGGTHRQLGPGATLGKRLPDQEGPRRDRLAFGDRMVKSVRELVSILSHFYLVIRQKSNRE